MYKQLLLAKSSVAFITYGPNDSLYGERNIASIAKGLDLTAQLN